MLSSHFYQDRICLNVLAKDIENAKQIYEIMDGNVLIGLISSRYETVGQALEEIESYDEAVDSAISIGLGNGDPNQWQMVAAICREYKPMHVNQVFSKVGYTRACVNNDTTLINGLVSPAGKPGFVNIATGPLNKQPIIVEARAAINLIKEMGGNSIKIFPLQGLKRVEEYRELMKICAEEEFAVEPTGGINLANFKQIVEIALQAGVKRVIPHVYSSIIDSSTGLTNVKDITELYQMIKELGDAYEA